MFERRYIRTELKLMALSNGGVNLCNGLESKLKSCRNVQVFKTCLKKSVCILMI